MEFCDQVAATPRQTYPALAPVLMPYLWKAVMSP